MEPVAWYIEPNELAHRSLERSIGFSEPVDRLDWVKTKLYSADQLATAVAKECQRLDDQCATLQAKLEQAEEDKAELLRVLNYQLPYLITNVQECSREQRVEIIRKALAKYEVKK